VLNIAHNATQVLVERIVDGDAQLVLRTRVARQVTFGGSAFVWHWNCILRTTAPACPKPSETASFTPWCQGGKGAPGSA
jgi:two-component system nitrogen regulation sensor histidine kinase GlnL